jgi:hypothetical protein
MKNVFLLLILLALLAATSVTAQKNPRSGAPDDPDVVLAPGRPPLTRGMLNQLKSFFEWILEGEFSVAQRERFDREIVAGWKKNDRETIDSFMKLLAVKQQLDGTPLEQREAARDELRAGFLEDLRKQPDDPAARLLLEVYEAAHRLVAPSGTASKDADSGAAVGSRARGLGVPAELVGEWEKGSVSATRFYNPATGVFAAPSGSGFFYRIHADGSYEFGGLMQQTIYGCTMNAFSFKTGRVAVEGQTLVFSPKSGTFKMQDNCRASSNYEKPANLDKESLRWRIERDGNRLKLCLMHPNGEESCYSRQ